MQWSNGWPLTLTFSTFWSLHALHRSLPRENVKKLHNRTLGRWRSHSLIKFALVVFFFPVIREPMDTSCFLTMISWKDKPCALLATCLMLDRNCFCQLATFTLHLDVNCIFLFALSFLQRLKWDKLITQNGLKQAITDCNGFLQLPSQHKSDIQFGVGDVFSFGKTMGLGHCREILILFVLSAK